MNDKRSSPQIEPGIIPLFRAFVILQLVVMVWNWVTSIRTPRFMLWGRFPQLNQWFLEKHTYAGIYLLISCLLALFLVYILVPQFQRWLGKYYLPVALIVQVILIVLADDLLTLNRLNSTLPFDLGSRNWQLFFFLFVPMIIASWQYDFLQVILLILFTTILELLFFLLVRNAPAFQFGASSAFLFGRSLLYVLIAYIVTHLMKDQRALRVSLQNANQQLKNYASTQEALATARERNRLSRELHDTLAHTLSGLVIHLEAVNIQSKNDPQLAQREFINITDQARAGLNEARRAIKSLRSAPLEEMGLLLALQQAAKEAALRGDFQLQISLPEILPFLPPEIENEVYRVAVEALENIVQHAHAQNVIFSMEASDVQVKMQIKDDGIGFDPEAVDLRAHFGLLGLRERADLHGAVLNIDSLPGKGTLITFSLEVPQ
jgi:signal transduction histidine kinase